VEVVGAQLLVPNADHSDAKCRDLGVPRQVASRMTLLLVNGAVQLDCQAQLRAIEVHDERADDLLASPSQTQQSPATEEFPRPTLRVGRFTPELSSVGEQERILPLTSDDPISGRMPGQTRLQLSSSQTTRQYLTLCISTPYAGPETRTLSAYAPLSRRERDRG